VRALARRTSDISHLRTTEAEIVFGEVEDYDSLRSAATGIEIVFHAAARVTPGWGSWQRFESAIVKGTENMIRASIDGDVHRFLHVSTGGVYGTTCEGETPANESSPCHLNFEPDNFYDFAKLKAEEAVFDHHVKNRINVSVIRVPAVYGPRDRLLADRLFRHMSLPVIVWPGKSNPVYSITCATDVSEFALLVASSDKTAGEVYNVAPAEGMRFRDFADVMIRAMGGPKTQITVPYTLGYIWCALMERWAKVRRVKDMPYLTRSGLRFLNRGMFLDGSKAKRELGWEPRVSIEEGIGLYLKWRQSCKRKSVA